MIFRSLVMCGSDISSVMIGSCDLGGNQLTYDKCTPWSFVKNTANAGRAWLVNQMFIDCKENRTELMKFMLSWRQMVQLLQKS